MTDFPALAVLHAACFAGPNRWSAASIEALLDGRGAFLCTSDHGFAIGRVAVDEAELLTLCVDPQARRMGAGRALLAAFEARAKALGAVHLHLEVAEDNHAAQSLYRQAGWRQAGCRPGYYARDGAPSVSALTLTKQVA